MSNKLRVSVIQACTVAYNLDLTLDKLELLTTQAQKIHNAQLAVFPEAFVGGYPRYSTFGAVVGSRSAEGRDEYLRYHQSAITLDDNSQARQRIEKISREQNIFLIVGVIEKDAEAGPGGTLYCSVVFISPQDGLVRKHRKLVPTATERLIWGQGDAADDSLKIVTHSFQQPTSSVNGSSAITARMSAAICWENYMPLLRTHYYTQLTQIHCAPTVDSRDVWQSSMTHIALEGRCFVLSACQFARKTDFPDDHPGPVSTPGDENPIMIGGGSVIVGPLGDILAGPLREEEGILSVVIDLDDCIRGKMDLDVTGHYARNDIFTLIGPS